MGRLSDEDYAEMSKDYADNPLREHEVISVEPRPGLQRGHPAKGEGGESKPMSLRFPDALRSELLAYADDNAVAVGEVVRQAVGEYLDRRANGSSQG
ncbi:hypothetical protein [Gordonia rhizosphera]|uniref:Ribbon-helix-helix protein CopG domain-containing protein n=1 Tax=Gordonia rhizosphera NBRC 16068 TaxID=1108045 RepID=K6V9Y8_9ACTN|nr:hypothetical protein [Gordonia rhizosphera]GAB93033.1 hypothetical protein GORHZ_202_00220 [Gordonia rhizosphera NBRC 16068]